MSNKFFVHLCLICWSFLFCGSGFAYKRRKETDRDICVDITGKHPKGIHTKRQLPVPGSKEVRLCCLCPPGTYYAQICSEDNKPDTQCHQCQFDIDDPEKQFFMNKDLHNETSCYKSTTCRSGFFRILGNISVDARCCPMDSYFNATSSKCIAHTKCHPGFGVKEPGDRRTDTLCETCLDGYQSPAFSALEKCVKVQSDTLSNTSTTAVYFLLSSTVTTAVDLSITKSSSSPTGLSIEGIGIAAATLFVVLGVVMVYCIKTKGCLSNWKDPTNHKEKMKIICKALGENINNEDFVKKMFRDFTDGKPPPPGLDNKKVKPTRRFKKCFCELMKLGEEKFNPRTLRKYFVDEGKQQYVEIIDRCMMQFKEELTDNVEEMVPLHEQENGNSDPDAAQPSSRTGEGLHSPAVANGEAPKRVVPVHVHRDTLPERVFADGTGDGNGIRPDDPKKSTVGDLVVKFPDVSDGLGPSTTNGAKLSAPYSPAPSASDCVVSVVPEASGATEASHNDQTHLAESEV